MVNDLIKRSLIVSILALIISVLYNFFVGKVYLTFGWDNLIFRSVLIFVVSFIVMFSVSKLISYRKYTVMTLLSYILSSIIIILGVYYITGNLITFWQTGFLLLINFAVSSFGYALYKEDF